VTPEEVKALTDEELRIKAAELAGWSYDEDYQIWYNDAARDPVADNCPDYPHDIAAAMELFALIPMPCGIERGYENQHGVGPIGFHVGFGVLPPEHDEDDVWAETVWNELAPRAITRAFLLAMTRENDGRI
jgi:hypothetical protein